MKSQSGKSFYGKRFVLIGCMALTLFSEAWGSSFCRCEPEEWETFRAYVAPQIERIKLTIEDFAIYRGVLKGGSVGFEYKPFCDFYCGVFGEWMMGSCNSEEEMSRYLHDINGKFRFGYTFPMWNLYKLTFTPFFGLGFEQIIHHIRSDLVLTSEKFRYDHYYLPFGLLVDLRISPLFGIGVVAERDKSINQKLKTPYIQGIKFTLRNESGYLIEFPFNFYIGSNRLKGGISFVPYLRHVVDGRLHARLPDTATLTMPEQKYTFWGLKGVMGVVF